MHSVKIKNQEIISKLESNYTKPTIENIYVGDIVTLGIKIQEGEKNRIQNKQDSTNRLRPFLCLGIISKTYSVRMESNKKVYLIVKFFRK